MALVGRPRVTEAVERVLVQALDDVPGLLVLVGPPGSGKTALAEAAVGRGSALGLRILRAAASPGLPDGLV